MRRSRGRPGRRRKGSYKKRKLKTASGRQPVGRGGFRLS